MRNYIFIVVALVLTACGGNTTRSGKVAGNAEVWTIGSEQVDCSGGVMRQRCYLIKPEGTTDWQLFYSPITNFEWEPGYEYVISVVKEKVENPPMDASSLKYTLDKVISKEKKTSEDIPDTSHMFND